MQLQYCRSFRFAHVRVLCYTAVVLKVHINKKMTNPVIDLVEDRTSFRKRIGINRQLFEFAMTKAESLINRICGENKLVYFCSEDNLDDNSGHVLNIMGFDENCICQASKDLVGLFQRFQSENSLSFPYIPQDLDNENDRRDSAVGTRAAESTLTLSPQSPLRSPKSTNGRGQSSCPSQLWHSGDAEIVFTPNGIQIHVFRGGLVEQDADAIVIMTNSKLQCFTSPGKDVVTAIGSRHADDCCSFLKDQGQLKPCQIMHSDAGNLWPKVRYVIHVAQPRPDDLNEPQKQHSVLEDFCFNCLQYANTKLKAKSISVPFLMTDSSAVMYPVVASAICKALLKYDQKITDYPDGSTLQEVKIVCSDRETVIVQLKTFDVFLPKLRSRSPRPFELNDYYLPLPDESHHQSKLSWTEEENVWWKERINMNYNKLQLKISLDEGLEGELMKRRVFTHSTLQSSMEEQSTPKKNKLLLNSLLQGDEVMFQNFCEALKLSGQDHIVSRYLSEKSLCTAKQNIPRSASAPAFSADLKLQQRWKVENLRRFQNELIEHIICDCGLISHLRTLQVFTDHQMAELEGEGREIRRNRLMLQWLARSSEGAHVKFCAALTQNKQAHLVKNYLTAGSHSALRLDKSVSFSTDLLNSDKTGLS